MPSCQSTRGPRKPGANRGHWPEPNESAAGDCRRQVALRHLLTCPAAPGHTAGRPGRSRPRGQRRWHPRPRGPPRSGLQPPGRSAGSCPPDGGRAGLPVRQLAWAGQPGPQPTRGPGPRRTSSKAVHTCARVVGGPGSDQSRPIHPTATRAAATTSAEAIRDWFTGGAPPCPVRQRGTRPPRQRDACRTWCARRGGTGRTWHEPGRGTPWRSQG